MKIKTETVSAAQTYVENLAVDTELEPLVDLVDRINNGEDITQDVIEYTDLGTDKSMLGCYRYIPEYKWVIFLYTAGTELIFQKQVKLEI